MGDVQPSPASRECVEHWIGLAGRMTALEHGEFERQLAHQWSAESLAPAIEAIDARRRQLAHTAERPRTPADIAPSRGARLALPSSAYVRSITRIPGRVPRRRRPPL